MRAVRFGSYSMCATFAGTPSLSTRLKSIRRYCRLWPPPWCRAVIRPCTLRPPLPCSGASSDFSGVDRVISAKSATLAPRRPGVVGLYLRIGIVIPSASAHRAAEGLDAVTVGQLHHGPLRVLALAPTGTGALALALPVERVHGHDAHVEDLLDRDLDLGLVRVRADQERVPVAVQLAVALLRDHRLDDHVTRVGDGAHSSASSSVSSVSTSDSSASASVSSTSDAAGRPSTSTGLPRSSPSPAAVKTTSSATSTS